MQQLLAVGGMGFVYAARHEVTGRAVAVKVLRPELAGRADLVERVSREARLAVDAAHPNVVQVLDAGADAGGAPYVVLERLYGEPLEVLLDRPLSLRSTLEALLPVCNALAVLHRAGIVHRDLKPSNIFLSWDEGGRVTPKLLDFGIAKALEGSGSTATGAALGTPAYMAPEQLLGCAVSPASDVWSLAVVAVRCLTGRLPFVDLARRGLLALGSAVGPSELEGVPEPVACVLGGALRFSSAERPPSAVEFRAQLLSALDGLGTGGAWPDPESISFAEHESELSVALKSRPSTATPAADSRRRFGRPDNVFTRTLSRAWRSAWARRARWWGALALLAGLIFALGLAQRPRATSTPSLEVSSESIRPAAENGASSLASSTAPPADIPLAAPAVAAAAEFPQAPLPIPPSAVKQRVRDVQRGPSKRPPPARLAAAQAERDGPEPEPAASPPALGANRSPIIE